MANPEGLDVEVADRMKMKLGDFVTLQRGHDLPEQRRRPGNIPIMGSFGITGYHDEAKASGPGVIIGRSGASFGVVSYSPDEFAYCLARSAEFREFAIQSMTGSSGRRCVPAESLAHFPVVSPSQPVAELFGALIRPLFARAVAASDEFRTLAALRDTLLPKLISGELRVKDAKRFVKEATPCARASPTQLGFFCRAAIRTGCAPSRSRTGAAVA